MVAVNGRLGEGFDELLAAARTGADWAWERIYDDLAPAVLGYLRARGAPDPDGVCGEVFCQLVRDINRFTGDAMGFRSWVFVMVHHRMLDDLRRRKRRPETPSAPEDMWSVADEADVEGQVVGDDTRRELRAALDKLTGAQREVLLLRIFGGLKVEEVARAMGKRNGAVKALQRRGLETLKDILATSGVLTDRGL